MLYTFDGPQGCCADATLVRDAADNLYGTSPYAGIAGCGLNQLGCGTVYRVTQSGKIKVLHKFDGRDGELPTGNLARDAAGNLYGTAVAGGNLKCLGIYQGHFYSGCGTIFKLDPKGKLTVLHAFDSKTDGSAPLSVVLDPAGNLYGIAGWGGDLKCSTYGCGTIFKVDTAGHFSVLYTFTSTIIRNPGFYNLLVLDSKGNLYDTTDINGPHNGGFLFELDTNGKFTDLFDFPYEGENGDGFMVGSIIMDTAGDFYGPMAIGGDSSCGSDGGCGTVFKLTF